METKWTRNVAFLMLACMLLAGCAGRGGQISQQERTVAPVVLDFIYASGDTLSNRTMEEVVSGFNESQNRSRINAIPSAAGSATYEEYLKRKVAVDEFPDFLDMRDPEAFVEAGKLAPIPEDLVELVADPVSLNGVVYTLPMSDTFPLGIIYNKRIFAEAGIEREPRTWEEFLQACERIKSLGIPPIVVAGKDLWHMGFWQSFFMGSYLYADNPDWNRDRISGLVHFTDHNMMQAMNDMTELWTKGYVNPGWRDTSDSELPSIMSSGKAAMLYHGSWMYSTIKKVKPDSELGYFVPANRQGARVSTSQPMLIGFALSSEAGKSPEKVAAFSEFIRYFYSKEVYSNYLKTNLMLPVTKEKIVYEVPEALRQAFDFKDDPQSIIVRSLHHYWGENKVPTSFRDWLWRLTQQWLAADEPDLQAAMEEADAAFDYMIKQ